jgi:hypothetical protein
MANGLAEPAPVESRIGRRVLVAYAVVALLLVGFGVAAFLLLRPTNHTFSTWKPNGATPQARAAQITFQVAGEYKLDSGKPLLTILYTPFQFGGAPVTRVGVGDPKTHKAAGLDTTSKSSVALYFLCQTAKSCPYKGATQNQVALLQAEGFEAALYALKYVPSLQSVLVALPSDLAQPPAIGMYVRRPNVKSLLDRPLSKTLGWKTPPRPGALSNDDAARIYRLTTPYTSRLQFTPFPADGSFGLVLLPLSSR